MKRYTVILLVTFCTALSASQTGEESGVAFSGFYRYGKWTMYRVPAAAGGLTLEAGSMYRTESSGNLLFKPGMFSSESVLLLRDSSVYEVVKGLSELKQDERLAVWYGYGVHADLPEFLKTDDVTYIVLQTEMPYHADVLGNVDAVVFERYPSEIYADKPAGQVKEWLMRGGTVVLTSREAIRTRIPSVFLSFIQSDTGREVTSQIRKKWETGKTFLPDEYCVIPAGFGRIICFLADRQKTGINANFETRAGAWKDIAVLSAPHPFPRENGRRELAGNIDAMIPLSAEQFNVGGTWTVVLIYCVAAVWTVIAAGGWKKNLFLVLLSLAASAVIIVFYSPPEFIWGSVCMARGESGNTVLTGYTFVKAASFGRNRFEFSDDTRSPWFPLNADTGSFVKTDTGERSLYSLGLSSFKSRIVYSELFSRLRNPVCWNLEEGLLNVDAPPIEAEEMYLFFKGDLYRLPHNMPQRYRLSDLKKIIRPSGRVSAAMSAGIKLGIRRDAFLMICGESGFSVPETDENTLHVVSGTIICIGPGDE